MDTTTVLMPLFVLIIAALYASVGHAGASGYLAAMALLGVAPAQMRPTALVLNIVVASIASWQFLRAGCFSWRVFWPCALASIPCAFLGGMVQVPGTSYKILVGCALLCASVRLLWPRAAHEPDTTRAPGTVAAAASGGAIGFASGLIGIGGGIFLSPVIILLRWATPRETAGISAVFILVNSIAGLAARPAALANLPPALPLWAAAAVLGGWLGAASACHHFSALTIKRLLAGVLVLAALKLVIV